MRNDPRAAGVVALGVRLLVRDVPADMRALLARLERREAEIKETANV